MRWGRREAVPARQPVVGLSQWGRLLGSMCSIHVCIVLASKHTVAIGNSSNFILAAAMMVRNKPSGKGPGVITLRYLSEHVHARLPGPPCDCVLLYTPVAMCP